MAEDSDSDIEAAVNNPDRDDPIWEDWHAQALDVQGGADDKSSSAEEEGPLGSCQISLPEHCVCKNCRYVCTILAPNLSFKISKISVTQYMNFKKFVSQLFINLECEEVCDPDPHWAILSFLLFQTSL